MIYTVTFNPSLDYVVDVESLTMGEVNRTKYTTIYPGGKGINVSIVLEHLGIDTRALGFTAGFTGEALSTLLAEKGINTDFVTLDSGMTRINIKLRTGRVIADATSTVSGETEINAQGPTVDALSIGELCEKLNYLDEDDYLVLAGSIPNTMPQTAYEDILDMLADSKLNFVVDASGDLLLSTLRHRPFLIKPNDRELSDMFGVEIKSKEDAEIYAKKLQEKGARNVLVSMAGEGALLVTEDGRTLSSKAPSGTVKNSVGSGDAMMAGFLAGYIESKDYEKALRMGICAGSASAFSETLATKEEIEALLQSDF